MELVINLKCKCCGSKIHDLVNLGFHELTYEYHTIDYIPKKYPIELTYCDFCFHLQLKHTININYENILPIIDRSYYEEFSKMIINTNITSVLDISCYDGSQLDSCKKIKENIITVGIEQNKNLYDLSSRQNDIYIGDLENTYKEISNKYNKFDIIICHDLLSKVNNPKRVLEICKLFMHDNTNLYITTPRANMINNGEIDIVYHQNLSFFNTNSIKILCDNVDLFLYRVTKTNRNYTFIVKRLKIIDHAYNVTDTLLDEINNNVYDNMNLVDYLLKCNLYKSKLEYLLLKYKLRGYNIIGYESTYEFNNLLNYIFPDGKHPLSYIIDERYIGLLTPGCNIAINSIESLLNITENTIIIICSYNYNIESKQEIINYLKINKIKSLKIKFLNINPIKLDSFILD